MPPLAALIQSHRETIIQRFVDKLKASITAVSLSRDAVIDNLHGFLDEIVRGLEREAREGRPAGGVPPSDSAALHGKQRFALGYDIGGVIREYGALRDVLYDLIEEEAVPVTAAELRIFSGYLLHGIGDAATQYGIERDAALRRQAAEHLAFLAHELRNPLSSLRLSWSLMKRRGELPASASAAAAVERAVGQLGELLDDALAQVRLDAVPTLSCEQLELGPFLETVAAESTPEAEAKRVRVEVRADGEASLQGDRKLLRSAISNLIRNAVKFSREGGAVHLRAKHGGGRVLIEVEDDCGGLPKGAVEKLFDPYVQAGSDRSGFGLGLAIAKQAVEAHGGGLRVHDLPGKGCVFAIDLPVRPVAPEHC